VITTRTTTFLLGGWLALTGLAGATGCTGAPSTPPEPVCAKVPDIAWDLPTEHRTPVPIPPDETAVKAAMALKTVVRDHATDPTNPWAISHALLAIGPETELSNGKKAVDWLFSEYAETFEVCGETLIRFPRKQGDTRIEPHTDLILKALTENGIAPDTPVTVDGKQLTVGHLYRGSLHRAWVDASSPPPADAPEGTEVVYDTVPYGPPDAGPGSTTQHWNDVPWALQGLTAYGPDGLTWTAQGDHDMDLDRFTHATVDRLDAESQSLQIAMQAGQTFDKMQANKDGGLVSMTCGGAHMLQGTAHALGRGFGQGTDKARFDTQIKILFWRYQAELDQYTELLQTQPRYRTLIMMQRLKFLGHFLETTHKWTILGVFRPDAEQERIMRDASVQLIATVAVLQQTGILDNIGKLVEPDTPEIYPGVISNEQLYLDYVGDSAHGYRGLDLALGHGVYLY